MKKIGKREVQINAIKKINKRMHNNCLDKNKYNVYIKDSKTKNLGKKKFEN